MKNIPIPPINAYLKKLIEKVENVIKRMRWKAFFFEQDGEQDEKITKSKGLTKTRTTNIVLNLENACLRLKIWKSLTMNS